jgi:tRNA(adenine34) deaminase
MNFDEINYRFMSAALKEAEKSFELNEVPIGAVITLENKIIGRGYNQIERLKDATAHAEILAITSAENYLGNWRLTDCDIFITVEPCIMCMGAILLARIKRIFFGVFDNKFGACGSLYNIAQEGKVNHRAEVYSGLMGDECRSLMQQFFKQKRVTGSSLE